MNLITFRKGMPILLFQIKVNPKNTVYEMKDGTGNIEVLGSEQCYNIRCREGDKLRLFCFQVKTIHKQPKLVSGDHSFIKVWSRQGTDLPKQKFTFSLGFQIWTFQCGAQIILSLEGRIEIMPSYSFLWEKFQEFILKQ